MDTKKLRQKILDLAIRGKLVPQDPNDEPASVLLERIRAEKEQLIKEGKIKRSKKSASADTSHYENVPFEVPEGWAWTTLGDLLNMQAGKNISANEIQSEKNEQTPYACYGGNGVRGFVTDYNTTGKHAIIGRQGALCGNINVAEGFFYATEHAVVVDVFGGTDTDWCIYMLEQLDLNQYATATAQPGLSVNKISEVFVPVPPKAEQKRISQDIQKWFNTLALIDDNKTTLNAAIINAKSKILDLAISGKLAPQYAKDEPVNELLKRINPDFKPADTSHYRNLPSGWSTTRLRDIFDIVMGQSPDGNSVNNKAGIEFHQGKIAFTEMMLQKSNVYTQSPTKICEPNSLLLCVRAPVGVLNITDRQICIGRGLCALKPKYDVDIEYWFYILSGYKNYFEEQATGTTFKAISGDTIKNTIVPIPPAEEQVRICHRISRLYKVLDNIAAEL